MIRTIKFSLVTVMAIMLFSCDKQDDRKELAISFQDNNYDVSKKDQLDKLMNDLKQIDMHSYSAMEDVIAIEMAFESGEYILLQGKAKSESGQLFPFTIPFKKVFLKSGIVSTSFSGCIMECHPQNCDQCRQEIIDPCQEQVCSCILGGGGTCSPYTKFK
jgi:hypothetical protein